MRKNPIVEIELFKNNDAGVKFHVKQFDDLRVNAKVYDGTEEVDVSNQNITVFVLKEDKTIIEQKKDILVEDNTIKINFSKQATTAMGKCQLEILLKDESGTSATSTISYMVNEKLSASISEMIKSEDDVDSLDMIEDFIQTSNVDILEIKEAIQDIKDNYETVLDGKKDEILDLLSNAEKEITARIVEKGEEIVGIADTTIEKAQEAIEAIDEALEDINNIQNVIDVALMDIEIAKDSALEDVETIKTASTEEISELKDTALEEVSTLRDNTIDDISDLKDESINNISTSKDTALEEIGTLKDSSISDINTTKDTALDGINSAIEDITALKDESIEEMNVVKTEVLEGLEGAIDEINTAKVEAIEEIVETKDSSIEALKEEEAGIIERISEIEISGTAGVDEAVKQAQKRLQELTIQSTWEVSQEAIVQAQGLQGVAGEQKALIRELAEAQKESVVNAGAEIIKTVENLEANIEEGLADINSTISEGRANIDRTISEGRTDIITNANNQVSRIQTEGQEIIDAVSNLEAITDNHIEDINKAGLSARESVESKSTSEINQINSIANNRKQEINELAENKIEAIATAGDEKLSEIREIVTTTEEDVVELLETTREEINTHRTSINTSVNEGLSNISTLKDTSIEEMTTTKDELIEEMLGAEIELKGGFEELRDEIVQEITSLGELKVDTLNGLIERINALELEIEKNLINSDKKAENLENTMQNVDAKVETIRPILNSLDEMRNICISLQSENAEANENIEELDFLHVESDTRIVEMRLLLDECKRYEQVLVDFIESKGGNHDEILLRLDALEESIIAIEDSILALEEVYATKEELKDYATKKELKTSIENAMKSTGLGVVGRLGAGLKIATELMPTKLKELKTPEHLTNTYGEVKHSYIYEAYPSSSGKQTWYKIIFFCDLDDAQNTGKYVSFKSGVFTFNGLERGKDYAIATTTSTFSEDPFYVDVSLSTINHNDNRTYSYYIDFNLYDENGEEILVNNPQKAGVNNLNQATDNGFYILDMDMSDYQELSNAPTLEGSIARGYLEVIGNTQKLTIVDGQSFIREIGGAWTRVDNKESTIATIGKSTAIKTPKLFKTAPATLRAFHREKERIVMFRATEDYYYVIKINSTYEYALSHNNTKFVINGAYVPGLQTFRYRVSDNEWYNKLFYSTSTVSNQDIAINQEFFQVYHSDFDITNTVNNKWSISKGLVANYDVEDTMNDFNNVIEAGYYNVNIEGIADSVSNSPQDSIQGILKVEKNNNVIYQELTSNDNKAVFKRVFDNNWSSWRYVGDEYTGVVGLTPKASVDINGVFDNVPNPPTIRGSEYIGKYMHSYLNSSKQYYVCTYLYKNTDTNKTPYISVTEYTNNTGSYHSVYGYDYDSYTCRTFMRYEDDAEWSTSNSIQSMTDLQTSHIYHHDMPIYTGGRDKTGVYREAMNADIIGDLDSCRKVGKYFVNVKKDEYNQIGNMPPTKVEKDVETTLYVNTEGEKTLQEITIEGITYTRKIGEKWTGLNNSFVKNDVIANIEGVEPNATDYEIETANIEDIYASCPASNNHKEPYGVIDFKDNSGRYYRIVTYGKGSGFYLYESGSSKTVGAYAYDQRYIARYTYSDGVWAEWTSTSSSVTYTYVSIGASGEILNSNLDVYKGTSNTAYDKTTIVRKADVKTDIKTINDFNEANIEGRYKVNILENKEALNAPETGVLSGALEVMKIDNMLKQSLTTTEDVLYTRVRNNEEWTEWKNRG